jgi:hypothetical protein
MGSTEFGNFQVRPVPKPNDHHPFVRAPLLTPLNLVGLLQRLDSTGLQRTYYVFTRSHIAPISRVRDREHEYEHGLTTTEAPFRPT